MINLPDVLFFFIRECNSRTLEDLQAMYDSVSSIGEVHHYVGTAQGHEHFCRKYRSNTQGLVHLLGIEFDGKMTLFRNHLHGLGLKLTGVDDRFTRPEERARRSKVSVEMHQNMSPEDRKSRGDKISESLTNPKEPKPKEPKVFQYQLPQEAKSEPVVTEKPTKVKKIRICRTCGGPVSGLGPKKFCSSECKNSARSYRCGFCGKEFTRYRGGKKFCSMDCMHKSNGLRDNRVTYTCQFCGKEFKAFPSLAPKFCSRECKHNVGRAGETKCVVCGKTIPLMRCKSSRTFCSRECRRTRSRKVATCILCGKEFEYIEGTRPAKFCSILCSNHYRLQSGDLGHKINDIEQKLLENLPDHVQYTGDHTFWVSLGYQDPVAWTSRLKKVTQPGPRIKNPDFVVRPFHETKRVIELFGGEGYWHTKEESVDLIRQYGEKGIDCLIVWEDDIRFHLSEVKSRVGQWLQSPHPFKKSTELDYQI